MVRCQSYHLGCEDQNRLEASSLSTHCQFPHPPTATACRQTALVLRRYFIKPFARACPTRSLTVTSLLSIVFMAFQLTDDIVRGMEPGGVGVLILVAYL